MRCSDAAAVCEDGVWCSDVSRRCSVAGWGRIASPPPARRLHPSATAAGGLPMRTPHVDQLISLCGHRDGSQLHEQGRSSVATPWERPASAVGHFARQKAITASRAQRSHCSVSVAHQSVTLPCGCHCCCYVQTNGACCGCSGRGTVRALQTQGDWPGSAPRHSAGWSYGLQLRCLSQRTSSPLEALHGASPSGQPV